MTRHALGRSPPLIAPSKLVRNQAGMPVRSAHHTACQCAVAVSRLDCSLQMPSTMQLPPLQCHLFRQAWDRRTDSDCFFTPKTGHTASCPDQYRPATTSTQPHTYTHSHTLCHAAAVAFSAAAAAAIPGSLKPSASTTGRHLSQSSGCSADT